MFGHTYTIGGTVLVFALLDSVLRAISRVSESKNACSMNGNASPGIPRGVEAILKGPERVLENKTN